MTERLYQNGFGNHFSTEARPGSLPVGQNSPQRHPLGLYTEKFSANAFTAPTASNARSWLYRIRPSVVHDDFSEVEAGHWHSDAQANAVMPPNPLRWAPLEIADNNDDFISGMTTMAAAGELRVQQGAAIHIYRAQRSMDDLYFSNADGEMLIVPEQGGLTLHTEFGVLTIEPGFIAVIPRGVRFRVELPDGPARGYVCENFGARFDLPERGPIGTDGLANTRDFEYPRARYEDREGDFRLLTRFGGRLFGCDIGHSPLDVVAWHGNLAPYRYDLRRFNTIGSISYDHPDPSIFTVLTSASEIPGTANADFVVFPPRWLVAEGTFRPPWFHRNVMSEFMGLIYGEYDAKKDGFVPGSSSLHNCMTAHGPDAATVRNASEADLQPQKLDETLAFMFETRLPMQPSSFALACPQRDQKYTECWQDLPRQFKDS